jgi:Plasmid pRiA4b ORF-3-like protein
VELAQAARPAISGGMTARLAIDSFTEIAALRIELKDSDPPIWRLVEVPTSITLKVLHDIVQVNMGWLDYHLWEFRIGGTTYGMPIGEDWVTAPRKIADRTRLRDVIAPGTTIIDYIYDFGDQLEHRLIVSDVRAGDPAAVYPRFIDGARNGPPEDCGGIPGFYDMLAARADASHPDHAEVSEWLDGYDPAALDVFPIQIALGRIAAPRNAAAKRIVKPAND